MAEIVESCTCGAEFRVKAPWFFMPEGIGDAIDDFRNRHAPCRGKRVIKPLTVQGKANWDRIQADIRAARAATRPEHFRHPTRREPGGDGG